MNIENAAKSISILCCNADIDNVQRFYFLNKFLEKNSISLRDLILEFNHLFRLNQDEIITFLQKNDELLENPNIYTKLELTNYIKEWIWDFLLEDKQLSEEKITDLSKSVIEVLKGYSAEAGWLFSYDLYDKLLEKAEWKDLEYYNLWKIDFSNIERKLENNEKDREIGFLRYKR